MADDEAAIREVIEAWMAATRAGDLEAVLGLMTDDAIFMVPGREPFGREAFASMSRASGGPQIDGKSELVELQVQGDWAFGRSHIDMTVTPPDGDPIHRSGYTLTIFCKGADGRWRLARDANLLTIRG